MQHSPYMQFDLSYTADRQAADITFEQQFPFFIGNMTKDAY